MRPLSDGRARSVGSGIEEVEVDDSSSKVKNNIQIPFIEGKVKTQIGPCISIGRLLNTVYCPALCERKHASITLYYIPQHLSYSRASLNRSLPLCRVGSVLIKCRAISVLLTQPRFEQRSL